jgi:dihydroxyacid dehydratase/phosphogluconate dehydratase
LTISRSAAEIPLLVNCMPSGKYLMEDFCYAGGMPAVLKELPTCICARPPRSWAAISATYAEARGVQPRRDPCLRRAAARAAGLRVLRGNLAPDGAIVKPSAATDALLEHEGPAMCSRTSRT